MKNSSWYKIEIYPELGILPCISFDSSMEIYPGLGILPGFRFVQGLSGARSFSSMEICPGLGILLGICLQYVDFFTNCISTRHTICLMYGEICPAS